jgi:hypothetical protein
MAAFVWGDSGEALTPEQIKHRRALTEAMLRKRIGDASPIQHPTQGFARVADALLAGFEGRRLDQAEAGNRAYNSGVDKILADLAGGGGGATGGSGGSTPGAPAPTIGERFPTSIGVVPDQEGTSGDSIRSAEATRTAGALSGDRETVRQYVRQAAEARGIDPDIAEVVVKQESGFNPSARNINAKEKSYGVMQLNTQGGLGAVALKQGIDPTDPSQWKRHVDFSFDTIAKDGWRQWYGARDRGIGRWDGIGTRKVAASETPDPRAAGQVASSEGMVPPAVAAGGAAAPAGAPVTPPASGRERGVERVAQAFDPRLAKYATDDALTPGRRQLAQLLLQQRLDAAKIAQQRQDELAKEGRQRAAAEADYRRNRGDTVADRADERQHQTRTFETQQLPFKLADDNRAQEKLRLEQEAARRQADLHPLEVKNKSLSPKARELDDLADDPRRVATAERVARAGAPRPTVNVPPNHRAVYDKDGNFSHAEPIRDSSGAVLDPEGAKATREAAAQARISAPDALAKAALALRSVEEVRTHPGRESLGATGALADVPVIGRGLPGSPARGFVSRVEQLQGQAFLEAFESLKGGGAISEKEGQKAEQAKARLQRAVKREEFDAALDDLADVIKTGRRNLWIKSGVPNEHISTLERAHDAIAAGKSREAVIKRLRENQIEAVGF